MLCLLGSKKFWLILIVYLTHFVQAQKNGNIEQVEDIVCESRISALNFKCNLEYGKIDLKAKVQIKTYKRLCDEVMKKPLKKCSNPLAENCNLATENMRMFCKNKYSDIKHFRIHARNIIKDVCQKAFNETKASCENSRLKLVKPKLGIIDKYLKLVNASKPKTSTVKPKVQNINVDSVIGSSFSSNENETSETEVNLFFNNILSQANYAPSKPTSPPRTIEKYRSKIQFLEKPIPKPVRWKPIKQNRFKPIPIRTKPIRPRPISISHRAQSIIDYVFGDYQNTIKTKDLINYVNDIYADGDFNPKKPVRVSNNKPIVMPNNQYIINYIFGKNPSKIHRHFMVSFIERIMDTKYESGLILDRLSPIQSTFKPKHRFEKPYQPIHHLNRPYRLENDPIFQKPQHRFDRPYKSKRVPERSRSKYEIKKPVKYGREQKPTNKIPHSIQLVSNYIFGESLNNVNKEDLVEYINEIYSDVELNDLKPSTGSHIDVKIPSIQSIIKFIFGKNPKKIHKHILISMIERILLIKEMPSKLIREKLASKLKPTFQNYPIAKRPSVSIQSIIDFIFGNNQKTIDQSFLIEFIKEIFADTKFDPKKPVKESNKPHIEMPKNQEIIEFIFGNKSIDIKKPVLIDFIDKIINNEQYHSEVLTFGKSDEKQKPTSRPNKLQKPIHLSKLKLSAEENNRNLINYVFGEAQYEIDNSLLREFLDRMFNKPNVDRPANIPISKPKSVANISSIPHPELVINYIFGNSKHKINKNDLNDFVNQAFGNVLPSKPIKDHRKEDDFYPKLQELIEYLFNRLKQNPQLFEDVSFGNKSYLLPVVEYILENYKHKINRHSYLNRNDPKFTKIDSKPNLLELITNVFGDSEPSKPVKNENLEKPIYHLYTQKPSRDESKENIGNRPTENDKKPFDISFVFNIISRLLGEKVETDRAENLDKGKISSPEHGRQHFPPLIQNGLVKIKPEQWKNLPEKHQMLLSILMRIIDALLKNHSQGLPGKVSDQDTVNDILDSFPFNSRKLEKISDKDKKLVISLVFKVIKEIFNQLSKHPKSSINAILSDLTETIGSARQESGRIRQQDIFKRPTVSFKPEREKPRKFDTSFVFKIIDELLNPGSIDSAANSRDESRNNIISIYDLFKDKNKAKEDEQSGQKAEEGEVHLRPAFIMLRDDERLDKETNAEQNDSVEKTTKPRKVSLKPKFKLVEDGNRNEEIDQETGSETQISKPSVEELQIPTKKPQSHASENNKIQRESTKKPKAVTKKMKKANNKSKIINIKTTKKIKKNRKSTIKPMKANKAAIKTKKTTKIIKKPIAQPKLATRKLFKTTKKPKKVIKKFKKTTNKLNKTTKKPKKTIDKSIMTTENSNKSTKKPKKVIKKSKMTTKNLNKTSKKPKKTSEKSKKSTIISNKMTKKPKKTSEKSKKSTIKSNKTTENPKTIAKSKKTTKKSNKTTEKPKKTTKKSKLSTIKAA